MAGNYPDAPGDRIAYDRDGTVGVSINASNISATLTNAALRVLNDEADDNLGNQSGAFKYCMIFPELRDIAGYLLRITGNGWTFSMETSPDTTTGVDGTWNPITGPVQTTSPMVPTYRTSAQAKAIAGVRAVRVSVSVNSGFVQMSGLHLYGKPSSIANTQRLILWHPTLDQPLYQTPAHLDLGNRPRSTTATRQFRIKNMSTVLAANSITVSVEALTDTAPTMLSQTQLAYGANPDAATQTITSLAPGEVSGVVTLKQALVSNATLGVWAQRVVAVPGSWS